MESTKKTAIVVGLLTVISVGIFIFTLAILSKWRSGDAGLFLNIKFKFLNNLSERAPVKVAGGINIGYVVKVYQKDLESYAKIFLEPQYVGKIPNSKNTKLSIFTTGLMGQKYINIEIPKFEKGEVPLKDNDIIRGIDPPSIDQIMLSFSTWFDGKNGGQVLAEIMSETQRFISNLNGIASENRQDIRLTVKQARESFTGLSNQLDVLMKKLNILSANVADISTKNKTDIQILLKNMAQISEDLNTLTQRINSGRGSVGKFMTDDQLYKNANQAMIHAKELLKTLKKNPSLLMYNQNKQ